MKTFMDNLHTPFFEAAITRLEATYVPSKEDWHMAEEQRMFLERKGYKLKITYPFDDSFIKSGYMNAYDFWIYRLGYEEEWRGPWTTSKEYFVLPF